MTALSGLTSTLRDMLATLVADFGVPSMVSGRYYDVRRIWDGLTPTSITVVINTFYAHQIWLRKGESLSALACGVTTFATGNVRIGLYSNVANGLTPAPSALLWDAGAVSTGTSNGYKDATSGAPYVATYTGLHWVCMIFDATPAVRRCSVPTYRWGSVTENTTIELSYTGSQAYGAMPASPPALTAAIAAMGFVKAT